MMLNDQPTDNICQHAVYLEFDLLINPRQVYAPLVMVRDWTTRTTIHLPYDSGGRCNIYQIIMMYDALALLGTQDVTGKDPDLVLLKQYTNICLEVDKLIVEKEIEKKNETTLFIAL